MKLALVVCRMVLLLGALVGLGVHGFDYGGWAKLALGVGLPLAAAVAWSVLVGWPQVRAPELVRGWLEVGIIMLGYNNWSQGSLWVLAVGVAAIVLILVWRWWAGNAFLGMSLVEMLGQRQRARASSTA
jgi:hypothetical protein